MTNDMSGIDRNEYRADQRDLRADFRLALHEALVPIAEELRALKEQVKIQNGRVSRLENWRWTMIGAGAVIYFAVEKVIEKVIR